MRYAKWLCTSHVNLGNSGYPSTRGRLSTTSLTSSSSIIAARVIGNLCVGPPQGVRDPGVNGTPSAGQHRVVRDPNKASAMSNYTSVVGSAQSDLKAIQAILVTLRDNGKHTVIPPTYREHGPSYGSLPDSTVAKWSSIGISPVAAASACFLRKVPSNRSEVDATTLFLEVLELGACPEELNMGAKRFLERCATYMKTFVQLASRDNHIVLGFCTTGYINGLGNMWEHVKNFHVPYPIKNEGEFTLAMLRDHLREFKMRPCGDLRGVSQSGPADNIWLSATRKRDGSINLSDPYAPIVISFRAIHRELHYFMMDASWESNNSQRLFKRLMNGNAKLMHLGHAWRCFNHLEDDEGNPLHWRPRSPTSSSSGQN